MYLSASPYGKKAYACAQSAWLAASVWLRLARLPPPASRVRRSRRLRDTLAAAPGLLAHALITETVKYCPMRCKLKFTAVHKRYAARASQRVADKHTLTLAAALGCAVLSPAQAASTP